MARFAVILAAAGKSSRFSQGAVSVLLEGSLAQKKVFADLAGQAVWLRSAQILGQHPQVCQTIVVVSPEDRAAFCDRYRAKIAFEGLTVVEGGAERADSVERALAALQDDVDFVAVHDAARPLVESEAIERVFQVAEQSGAAILAAPIVGTVKRVGQQGDILETVPREGLWEAQTPQVCRRDWLEEAYRKRGPFQPTDEAHLLQNAGYTVQVVESSRTNLKITTADDLKLALALLQPNPQPTSPPAKSRLWDDEDDQ